MKTYFFVLILLGGCQLCAQEAGLEVPNFDSALNILTTTIPLRHESIEAKLAATSDSNEKAKIILARQKVLAAAYGPDGELRAKAEEQMLEKWYTAIDVIHKAHKEVDLSVLMPFLDLTKDMYAITKPSRDLNETRKQWPVFAVILDMPNAAEALEKYSLDSSNYIDFRLDACNILRFLDKDRGKAVAGQLEKDIAKRSPSVGKGYMLQFVHSLEDHSDAPYRGPVHLAELNAPS